MRKYVYFIGIGGIGMSAIARYYNHAGYIVSGYDKTPSPLTDELQKEGIEIHFVPQIESIPQDKENTLVIYTPAIPADMEELVFVMNNGYRLIKRSKALGEIASEKRCLAVAGTHGKTTTSTMLAHIIQNSGEGATSFLGGISKNYGTNLLLSNSDVLVAEADEFDRSFLQLKPSIAVITSMDADHLDIYNDEQTLIEAFKEFASGVSGSVVVKKGLEGNLDGICAKCYTYSYDDGGDFYPFDIRLNSDSRLTFSMNLCGEIVENCTVGVPGKVNVENAVAASAVAYLHGTPVNEIREALKSFSGVKRRFDIRFEQNGILYIDDYAHHPRELAASISSIKEIFPGRKLCAVFQPHLFSRTKDFYKEFAQSLSLADSVIMLPIYPAREEPIPGITSEIILERITCPNAKLVEKSELISEIRDRELDILVTFGAGDIDRLVAPVENYLKEHYA